ncbi:MAG: NCS2 family permease [Victivallales bacterium]|nr:NCS2 family permease [Victivallales bacterium]
MKSIKSFFKVEERGSNVATESMAGITTFLTMSYIIFLQPYILSGAMSGQPTGMDIGALTVGVCIAAAFGSILMGMLANYPVALAPGMGENFFFISVVASIAAMGITPAGSAWQLALAVVLCSGLIFLILSFLNVRELLMIAISPSMKSAIAAGIGLFIALIGLRNGNVITTVNGHYILNADGLGSAASGIFLVGLLVTAVLHVLKIRGSVLWGIVAGAAMALVLNKIHYNGIVAKPPSIGPIFAKMDLPGFFANFALLIPYVIIFTFMDVFDTLGTLVGVSTQSGLMKDGKLPKAKQAFAADSIGTIVGVFYGQSTVTAYIESSTGVEYGGRTGLTAVVTGLCFIAAVFFTPLIAMIGNYPGGINPITAPALVIVGAMMMKSVRDIDWDDFSEAVPSFLIMAGIPFTFSIADGLTLGFITYPAIKLFSGKAKEAGWLTYLIGGVLLAYLLLVKTGYLTQMLK